MKKTITGIFVSTIFIGFSQNNVVSSGGNSAGPGGTQSYSIGQIDYINSNSASGNVNQGVQQPFEFYANSSGLNEASLLGLKLYPNPTNEFIILNIESIQDHLNYQLIDLNGRIISKGKINSNETIIDAREYSAGEYHLSIQQNDQQIQSFKIIKN